MRRMAWAVVALIYLVAPASAQEKPLSRIAFGSCASQEKPQPIWDAVLATSPELFLFLGDAIYADTDNPEIMKRKYAQLAAVPGFQKLRSAVPIMAVWDDHDYGVDDAGGDYSMKVESQRIFLDFFQVPKVAPQWNQKGVYSARVFGPSGKRVQVILLDTRYHRSPLKKSGKSYVPNTDPAATFLGAEQWKWLEEQLKAPAEVRLIGSSIQVVAEDHPYEKWANLPNELDRLHKMLRESKATGVIILSGDRHLAELSQRDAGIGYPLYDLTSSGLNQAARRWRPMEKNSHRVATMNHGDNFGMVLIDWDKPEPVVRMQIRDVGGDVVIQERIDLAVLKPTGKKPGDIAAAKPVSAGAVNTSEAANKVGEKLTVEFDVKATGQTRDKSRIFLNSAEFRDPSNFTVVLDMKAAGDSLAKAGVSDPRNYYKGKTVRVTGTVSVFNNSPQIVVSDASQVVLATK